MKTTKEMTALEAKNKAQEISFAPILFQCVIALKRLGILTYIFKHRKKCSISDICENLKLSDYSVRVLLEMAESADIVEITDEKVTLTKLGYFLHSDEQTNVNINFIHDVCYQGAFAMTESVRDEKPVGLKEFGDWSTIYKGLSQLPKPVQKSWFDFDHYYSNGVFDDALKIVFQGGIKSLVDIGGNTGIWSSKCLNYDNNVEMTMVDLPEQIELAKQNENLNGFDNRLQFFGANMLDPNTDLPKGKDAYWMSQFLDCFSKPEIVNILKAIRKHAAPHSKVFILEPFHDNQTFPLARYSLTATSLYFTCMANGNSKMYAVKEMADLAEEAGFKVENTYELIGNSYHTILEITPA